MFYGRLACRHERCSLLHAPVCCCICGSSNHIDLHHTAASPATLLITLGLLLQVPFIGWTGDMPLAGNSIQKLLQAAARPFVSTFMKRTGQQFLMHDREDGQAPLLVSQVIWVVYTYDGAALHNRCHTCVCKHLGLYANLYIKGIGRVSTEEMLSYQHVILASFLALFNG